jgi:hypothetical protein
MLLRRWRGDQEVEVDDREAWIAAEYHRRIAAGFVGNPSMLLVELVEAWEKRGATPARREPRPGQPGKLTRTLTRYETASSAGTDEDTAERAAPSTALLAHEAAPADHDHPALGDFFADVLESDQRARTTEALRISDTDRARRKVIEGQLLEIADILALDPWGLELVVDKRAAARLDAAGVRGQQEGTTLYLHPDLYDPRGEEGRYLLAHELVHAKQRTLRAGDAYDASDLDGSGRVARAEVEASSLGRAYARGDGMVAPSVALSDAAPANDGPTPDEKKLLASPPTLGRVVHMIGIKYKPQAEVKWIGGVDKRKQALSIFLFDLLGAKYTVDILYDVITANGGIGKVQGQGKLDGNATQDEKVEEFYVLTRVAMTTVNHLKSKGFAINLTAEHLKTLQGGLDVEDTWPVIKPVLPGWFNDGFYRALMSSNPTELTAFGKALHTWADNKTEPNKKAVEDARDRVKKKIMEPAGKAIEAIRVDTSLAKEPGYRVLWELPAPAEGGPAVEVKVGPSGPINFRAGLELVIGAMFDDKDLAAQAVGNRGARVTLLKNMVRRVGEAGQPKEGDQVLRDGTIKSTKPPLSSSLRAWPALEAPFFDTPKGGDREFVMSIGFPDVFEAFRGYRYKWELMQVPDADVKKLAENEDPKNKAAATGDNKWLEGSQPGQMDVLGNRLDRDVEDGKTDIKRSIQGLTGMLGEPGVGAVTLVTANAMLRMVGTVIRAFIETLTKPHYEKTMPFPKEGLYVVRCTAWPTPVEGAVIDRGPSVSWMPVWVRPTQDMSKLRVNLDSKLRDGAIIQLKAIEEALKDPTLQDPANKDTKAALEKQRDALKITLWGSAGDQFELEKKQLNEAIAKSTDAAQKKRLQERIDDIDTILKMREKRMKDAPAAGSTLEAPFKIPAAFVADKGQTMRPTFEAFQLKGPKGKFTYKVIDSTTKNSGVKEATASTREQAIQDAVVLILESGQGYGRGHVTLNIPKDPGGKPITIRVEKSLGELHMEAIENLAMVASIAAVAAAPFTGGASLALMVPIGIVGAIPSAYRLIDRAEQGTLRMDMATVMDIVNILGAAVGAGTAKAASVAALKGIPLSQGYMILGLGNDGLGMIVMGVGFVHELNEIDKDGTMPKGLRNARIAELVGNQLVQIGMMVGASLAAHGKSEGAKHGAKKAEPVGPRVGTEITAKFHEAVGPKGADIPVFRDETGTRVAGDGVQVVFERDGYGLPTDAKVIMGPGATAESLMKHVNAAKVAVEYQGFLGWLRNLKDRMTVLFKSGKLPPKHGSNAHLAQVEINKISDIVAKMTDDLGKGKITPEAYGSKLKDYQEQLAKHEQALTDFGKGPNFIAAQDNVSKAAKKAGYPDVPPDHYYYETGDGRYQLARAPDSNAPQKHIDHSGKTPKLVDGPFKGKVYNKTAIADLAKPLGKDVTLHDNAKSKEVSVRPMPDGSYEVHYKKGTAEAVIKDAIDRHLELRAERPKDLKNPYKKDGSRWTGADEAAYLGRPTEEGYHWALADGKLQIVSEDPKAHPKKVWDDAKGKAVIDTGAPKADGKFGKNGNTAADLKKAKADAFEVLGGNDPSSDFGAWVAKANEYLGLSKADLMARMGNPSELNHRTVRNHVKDGISGKDNLTKKMVDRISLDSKGVANDRAFLKERQPDAYKGAKTKEELAKADKAASHAEMLELTDGMGSGDRGSVAEQWYHANYEPKADRHVTFDQASMNKQGISLTETREPDIVGKTKINEIKHTNGPLGDRDLKEIADYRKLLDKKITVGKETYNLKEMTVVFPEPNGGHANAKNIAEFVTDKKISVEVFNSKGEKRVITTDDLKKGTFNTAGGEDGLIKAIQDFCK